MMRNGVVGISAVALLAQVASAEPVSREQVEAALPELRRMAESSVASGGVPGLAIAVVHDDAVVFLDGFGLRAADKPERVGADTVFQLASMSKPISSTVVAGLVSKGLVDWDSKVSAIDPVFQLHDPYPSAEVTVRDLFNHRSGLPGSAGNDLEDIGFDRETVMHRLRLVPPWASFRAGYSYSNAGLTAGALAAAAPSGKSWEAVADETLFAPLGMATASFRHADFAAHADAAALHIPVDGKWTALLTRDATVQAPAGGASASARDLGAWMRLELANGLFGGERLISAEALAQTHVPLMARGKNPVTGAPEFYGLGWNVEYGRHGVTWGHAGAFSVGARTLVTLWPDSDLGIVILANAFPTGVPEGISDSFGDLVFDGKVQTDYFGPWNGLYAGLFAPAVEAAKAAFGAPPADASAQLPASAYVGTYANDYVGEAVVSAEGDMLTVAVGPTGKTRYPLAFFDRDTFLYYPSPELPDVPSPLRFRIGPDGKADAMTMDSLDANGLGTLLRRAP